MMMVPVQMPIFLITGTPSSADITKKVTAQIHYIAHWSCTAATTSLQVDRYQVAQIHVKAQSDFAMGSVSSMNHLLPCRYALQARGSRTNDMAGQNNLNIFLIFGEPGIIIGFTLI